MLDGQTALYEVKPLSEVGKICHRAAEILEAGKFSQGSWEVVMEGGICLIKALSIAGRRNIGQMDPLVKALSFKTSANAITWNDTHSRAEVLARLRSVK